MCACLHPDFHGSACKRVTGGGQLTSWVEAPPCSSGMNIAFGMLLTEWAVSKLFCAHMTSIAELRDFVSGNVQRFGSSNQLHPLLPMRFTIA